MTNTKVFWIYFTRTLMFTVGLLLIFTIIGIPFGAILIVKAVSDISKCQAERIREKKTPIQVTQSEEDELSTQVPWNVN